MTDIVDNDEVLDNPAETVDTAVTDAESIAQSHAEEKARSMGWTPKEDFKGDPAKWCSADEFVKRGEEFIPFLKSKVTKQEREISELKEQMRDFGQRYNNIEQATYNRAIGELSAKRKEAVELGDHEAFAAVDDEIDKLKSDMAGAKSSKPASNDFTPIYKEWEEKNTAWVNDPVMGSYAEEIGEVLAKRGITGVKFLDAVEKEVKAKFSHRFAKANTNPNRETAQSVESGAVSRKGTGNAFGDMPVDQRKACKQMADNFFSTDAEREKFTKDFTKNYFSGVQ